MKTTIVCLFLSFVLSFGFAANYTITIDGFTYSPSDLTVNVGDALLSIPNAVKS